MPRSIVVGRIRLLTISHVCIVVVNAPAAATVVMFLIEQVGIVVLAGKEASADLGQLLEG